MNISIKGLTKHLAFFMNDAIIRMKEKDASFMVVGGISQSHRCVVACFRHEVPKFKIILELAKELGLEAIREEIEKEISKK